MKFPSASRSAGLGTGEYDAGFETELSWAFERFTPFLNGGYRYLGSPPGFELNNVFVATVGGMYRVVDPLNLGLLLDYRGVASTSTGKRLELVPFASWKAQHALVGRHLCRCGPRERQCRRRCRRADRLCLVGLLIVHRPAMTHPFFSVGEGVRCGQDLEGRQP